MRNARLVVLLAACGLSACDASGPSRLPAISCAGVIPLSLAVGDHLVLDPTSSGSCVRLAPLDAEYVVAALSASGSETSTGVSGNYTITGGDDASLSAMVSNRRAAAVSPDFPAEFHAKLRQRERDIASDPAYRAIAVKRANRAIPPALGSKRTFKVCRTGSCTDFVDVRATAVYAGQRGVVFLDDTVPAGGYTPAEIDSVGRLFDEHLYPIDTTAFGRESDVDGNGVVLILLTDQVNQLSTTCGLYVTGYFFGLDLMDDPHSNRGEVFYGMVPNTSGVGCTVPKTFARRTLAPTFIHEFQHMISFNRHHLLGGGEAEETWLNEGLSVFAEELGGRLIPDAECIGGQANACLTQFVKGDLERAYEYLAHPEDAFLVEPGNSSGTLAERGANWLFLRWLADRSATDSILGTDITRGLTGADNPAGTALRGASNVTAMSRANFDPTADFEMLVGEWQLANCLEGMPGFSDTEESGRLRYKTWNLPAAFSGLVLGPYPLNPRTISALPFSQSGILRAGSGPHLHVLSGATAQAMALSLSTTNGTAVKPRVAVVRIH